VLSVVIPTKNRSALLIRLLAYYCRTEFRHRVVIADSSSPDHVSRTRAAVEFYRAKLGINYRIYDPTTEAITKLCDSFSSITTPYSVLGADDDFFVPASLDCAVQFLVDHPGYSAAHGEALAFGLCPDNLLGKVYSQSMTIGPYTQRAVEHLCGTERLLDHLANYTTTWYSVQSTENLRTNFGKISANGLGLDPDFAEITMSCLSLVQGRTKKLKMLYMARQVDTRKEYAVSAPVDRVLAPDWSAKYQSFEECLAPALADNDGIGLADARTIIRKAYGIYLGQSIVRKWPSGYPPLPMSPPTRWQEIVKRIPGIYPIWRVFRPIMPASPWSPAAFLNPSCPYHNAFMPIYSVLTAPPSEPELLTVA